MSATRRVEVRFRVASTAEVKVEYAATAEEAEHFRRSNGQSGQCGDRRREGSRWVAAVALSCPVAVRLVAVVSGRACPECARIPPTCASDSGSSRGAPKVAPGAFCPPSGYRAPPSPLSHDRRYMKGYIKVRTSRGGSLGEHPAFLVVQLGAHLTNRFVALLAPLGIHPRHFGMMNLLANRVGLSQHSSVSCSECTAT